MARQQETWGSLNPICTDSMVLPACTTFGVAALLGSRTDLSCEVGL